MEIELKCPNGKIINMTPYILKQMAGELTRKDVEKKIEFYTNKNK